MNTSKWKWVYDLKNHEVVELDTVHALQVNSIPVSGKVDWKDGEDVTDKFTVHTEHPGLHEKDFAIPIKKEELIVVDKDDFEKFAEQAEKDNIKWHERFEELPDIDALMEKHLPNNFRLSSFKPKEILLLEAAFQQGAQVMFHTLKNREESASSIPIIDKGEEAIAFAEWFMSDNNSCNKIYQSDDDNDGKWYDEFSEGINRHYFTTKQLYNLFKR